MRVTQLLRYPLKSGAAVPVQQSTIEARGLARDRRWMLVDSDGAFLTQRELPALARLRALPTDDGLALAWGDASFDAPFPGGPRAAVTIWDSSLEVPEVPAASAWLSERLGRAVRLVHLPDDVRRPVNPERGRPGDQVSFADGYPVLVASEASLADLNARIAARGGDAVPMDRFRPNVVVDGDIPWAEDGWGRLRLGEVELEVTHGCMRCVMTTVDQATGTVAAKEPLATLATFRKRDGQVYFGVNAIPRVLGTIRVGDEVVA